MTIALLFALTAVGVIALPVLAGRGRRPRPGIRGARPVSRIRFRGALAAVLMLAAGIAGSGSVTAARAAPAAPGTAPASALSPRTTNWGAPVFTDNFSGTTLGHAWSVYNDPQAAPPAPKRTASSVVVRNGLLELIGHYQKPYGYVSGGISYNANQVYGRWEVRFRADAGAGYAPVVLLWPQGPWPADGEIDMAEISNPQRHGGGEFLHLGARKHFTGHQIPASVDFTRWHTLAVDWLADHITFWLDGKQLWTVHRGSGTGNYIPSTPFHLALQNDEGCDVGCKPNQDTPKQVIMDVDWVRVYAAPGRAAPVVLKPGSQAVRAAVFSPAGTYLATASADGRIYLWALPGYHLHATLTDPASRGVTALAFTTLGHYLAAADGNGRTYVWAVATGKILAILSDPGSTGVTGVAYSPDGTHLATADRDGQVYLWALPDYKLQATLTDPASGGASAVAITADSTALAACDGNGATYIYRSAL